MEEADKWGACFGLVCDPETLIESGGDSGHRNLHVPKRPRGRKQ